MAKHDNPTAKPHGLSDRMLRKFCHHNDYSCGDILYEMDCSCPFVWMGP
jgi:hypothetical protein